MPVPLIYFGALTCSECGHDWHDHRGTPPYTGLEWCEGGGWITVELPWHDFHDEYLNCPCQEFLTCR